MRTRVPGWFRFGSKSTKTPHSSSFPPLDKEPEWFNTPTFRDVRKAGDRSEKIWGFCVAILLGIFNGFYNMFDLF